MFYPSYINIQYLMDSRIITQHIYLIEEEKLILSNWIISWHSIMSGREKGRYFGAYMLCFLYISLR